MGSYIIPIEKEKRNGYLTLKPSQFRWTLHCRFPFGHSTLTA